MQASALFAFALVALAAGDPTPQATLYPSSGFGGKPSTIYDLGNCVNVPEEEDAWYNVHSFKIRPSVECDFFKSEDCERFAGRFKGEEEKFITSNIQSVFCVDISQDEV